MELSIFIPSLLIFLVLVLSFVFGVPKKSESKPRTPNPPPGPPGLPLIGNLHQLLGSLPHIRLSNLAKTYGPLMHLQLGQISAVIVSSPEIAKQLFKDFDINFSGRGRQPITDIVLFNSRDIAFSPHGEYWRKVRKIAVLHLFSAKRVQTFRFVREEEVSNCVSLIRSKLGSPVNISDLALSLVNSVLGRIFVGSNDKNREILLLIERVMIAVGGFDVVDMFPSLGFIHVLTRMKPRLLKIQKDADALFEDLINERKAGLKGGLGDATNLLDVLLKLQGEPNSPLTSDSIKGIIMEMFAAGTDKSATVLEWAMSELMKHPSVMRKAQEEVR